MENENTSSDCNCKGNSNELQFMPLGWIPDGSTANSNPDGSITIAGPDGWMYIGFDNNYQFCSIDTNSVTISCACGSSGGCMPFARGSLHGCATKDCSSFNMNTSSVVNGVPTTLLSGGFINLSIPAAIMTNDQALPAVFPAMLSSPQVITIIQNFLTSIYDINPVPQANTDDFYSFTAPEGYKVAFVNICGRATPFILPDSALDDVMMTGGGGSCICTSGTCTYDSKLGVQYCKGDCSGSCSLTINNVSVVGGTSYSAVSFTF